MNLPGAQKYNYQQIRKGVDNAIADKEFTTKLYRSVDGVLKVIDAIVQTKGEGWALQVLDEKGNPMFSKQEQQQFTDAFEPYIANILDFFGEKKEQMGGAEDIVDSINNLGEPGEPGEPGEVMSTIPGTPKMDPIAPTNTSNPTNSKSNSNSKSKSNSKNTRNKNRQNNAKTNATLTKRYVPTATELSGMSEDFLQKKIKQATQVQEEEEEEHPTGIDDLYAAFINKIRNVDQVVNDYASKYGVLKLEKEHDLQPDIRLVPEPLALLISQGVTSVSAAVGYPISPTTTLDALSKIKVPFRTIVFVIYMALDIVRLSMAITGQERSRKMLSVLLSVLELLRGDWKKAILTFMGYYGMNPLLFGQMGKILLTGFRMFSPDLQDQFVYGTLDASKSFVIGLLLSIFQVTAPEEVRLPLIASLEKIAQRKAIMDGVLEEDNLSARPNYLSPTFEDLNNIQAVMTDPAYVCSCEFEELVKSVDQTAMIRTVIQLLRMPVTKEFRKLKCGDEPCKPYVKEVVEEVVEESKEESPKEQKEQPKEEQPKEEQPKEEQPKEETSNPPTVVNQQEVKQPSIINNAPNIRPTNRIQQKGGRKLHIQRKNI
jgi:flagellum-specific peptidoglycan hydrolase FlgJ